MVELIWDGKYDADGRRAAPLRVALPFQTVETVNESSQQRQKMLDLFSQGRDPDWRNRLIWADNATVLTDVDWRYVKVMQRDFEQLQPAQFSDCAYLGQTHGSMFED